MVILINERIKFEVKKMKPFITLCMIIKDEEKVLRRCLDSVKGIVDEVVIVDTGSRDNSKKIAKEYTNKVYDFQWVNDFSKARNFAASKASGEWILALDADEYVDRSNLKDMKEQIKNDEDAYDIYSVKILNFSGWNGQFTSQHYHERIYKNDGNIRYSRPIHEQLIKNQSKGKEFIESISKLIIYHSGYLTQTFKEKEKSKRNMNILKEEIKKTSNPFDYFNLANEYSATQEYEKALRYYKKAFQLKSNIHLSWVSYTVIQIIHTLNELERFRDSLVVVKDAMNIWCKSPELKFLKGYIYYLQHRYDDAIKELIELTQDKERYDKPLMSLDYLYSNPYELLGEIYYIKSEYKNAMNKFTKVLSYNRNNLAILKKILYILNRTNSPEELADYISAQGFIKSSNDILQLVRILIENAQFKLAKIFISSFDGKEVIKNAYLLKIYILENNINKIEKIIDKMRSKELIYIIKKGYFDFYDVIILKLLVRNIKFDINISKSHDEHLQMNKFIDFVINNNSYEKIEEKYFINMLEKCLQYRQFDIFEKLTFQKYCTGISHINGKIGNLLVKYDFIEIAIEFYKEIKNIHTCDSETVFNIVNVLYQKEAYDDALVTALRSLETGHNDFRIFKIVMELLYRKKEFKDLEEVIKLALNYYPDSFWIKKMYINS
ncbi:MAG: glycosyltransferase [Firmicutes bacterium]|nr:glycosyltransferase [Bacillota bacterium]